MRLILVVIYSHVSHHPPHPTLFPYTTLFLSAPDHGGARLPRPARRSPPDPGAGDVPARSLRPAAHAGDRVHRGRPAGAAGGAPVRQPHGQPQPPPPVQRRPAARAGPGGTGPGRPRSEERRGGKEHATLTPARRPRSR